MYRAIALVATICVPAACVSAPAAAPAAAPIVFPFAVDTHRIAPIAPGALHRFVYSPTGPWAIHVLDVDRTACYSAVAVKGFAGAVGRRRTSDLLAELDSNGTVIGGVNADFFRPDGTPTNAHIAAGRVLTPATSRPLIAFDSAGKPSIVVLRALDRGADGAGTGRLTPFHPREAVGGRPILVRDSVIVPDVDTVGGAGFATARHPRTAVGIARDGARLVLVTVDGRQAPYSAGMTLRELATLLLALGARDAINLDGGGSTTLVTRPEGNSRLRVINKPSDAAGERAVGNALAIIRRCDRR